MSSNCPPQLHLTLPASTTSFKRSFEQFGFDLESPVVVGTDNSSSGSTNRNDRNKRARSASSFSDSDESVGSSQSSTVASTSTETSAEHNEGENNDQSALTTTRPPSVVVPTNLSISIVHSSLEPPRLPTPDIEDIEMPDYPLEDTHESEEDPDAAMQPLPTEPYQLSLQRFHAFDSQISALRRSRSRSPTLERSPTPPPTLPPLALSEESDLSSPNAIPFLGQFDEPSMPTTDSRNEAGPSTSNRSYLAGPSTTRNPLQDERRRLLQEFHEDHNARDREVNHRGDLVLSIPRIVRFTHHHV